MKHRVGFNKLGLKTGHRKALHRNMTTSLFRYERITTTKSKALAVKRTVEKMITKAKVDSVHNRRQIARDIKDKEILAKLFTDIAPRNGKRPGGYTRVLKIGARQGDAADMVILELVEKEGGSSDKEKTPKKSKEKKTGNKETEVKKSESAPKAVKEEETPKETEVSEEKNDTSEVK
ncbi:MAG: 50S ribosomal protein L17 [Spirochaetales bacterium]|nr:50S ribosomal protein L17 [Spirochaetales bacterium]